MTSSPKISVISVTMNDALGLSKTIASIGIQKYPNIEYILIDGGSVDGSDKIIRVNRGVIDKVLIEPDVGIYHAMNKGIRLADGEWLLFMNAGDVFSAPDALSKAVSVIRGNVDVVYSDWIYCETGRLVKANLNKLNVRHQSVMYRKHLHESYGNYVVGKRVSISDYIFFLSIAHKNWRYCATPISICEQQGTSANPAHFYQRIASELIFGKRTRLNACFILLAYPFYRFIKRNILRLR